jgi:hypothetical protein
MTLETQLTGESSINIGERKFRCPKCNKWIRINTPDVDFVHENCSTKWKIFNGNRQAVFKDELLEANSGMHGMLSEPPDNPKRRDSTIDKEETDDFYFCI